MPDRSTDPGRPPDGALLDGSIDSLDPSAAMLVLDRPAKPGIDADGGMADATAAAERLDTILTSVSILARQLGQLADEQSGSRADVPEAAPVEPDHGHRLEARTRIVAGGLLALLERRGMRSSLLGVVLVGVAVGLGLSSSVAVALLIVGVVMLIVGLMGRRLQGRFAIEFGPSGASFEIQTHMASPGSTQLVAPLAPWQPEPPVAAAASEDASQTHDAKSDN